MQMFIWSMWYTSVHMSIHMFICMSIRMSVLAACAECGLHQAKGSAQLHCRIADRKIAEHGDLLVRLAPVFVLIFACAHACTCVVAWAHVYVCMHAFLSYCMIVQLVPHQSDSFLVRSLHYTGSGVMACVCAGLQACLHACSACTPPTWSKTAVLHHPVYVWLIDWF